LGNNTTQQRNKQTACAPIRMRVNNPLPMEEHMADELKQIGPRIRDDVYQALVRYSTKTRQSQSVIVEQALVNVLREAGYDIQDYYRH
jgi:hypothetical protein